MLCAHARAREHAAAVVHHRVDDARGHAAGHAAGHRVEGLGAPRDARRHGRGMGPQVGARGGDSSSWDNPRRLRPSERSAKTTKTTRLMAAA